MNLSQSNIYVITGENGCGKSTYLDSFYYKNRDKSIFYIRQNDYLFENMTVIENLMFCGFDCSKQWNQFIDIESVKDLYPAQLSLGQRQILAIICAVSSQSHMIILDETMSALSQGSIERLIKLFKELSSTCIIIVSHQKEIIDSCDVVIPFTDLSDDFLEDLKKKENKRITIRYFALFGKRHWKINIGLLFLLAVCFVSLAFTMNFKNFAQSEISEGMTSRVTHEGFIFNNTNIYAHQRTEYAQERPSITIKNYDKLKSISGLSHFNAYIPFTFIIKHDKYQNPYYEKLTISQQNAKRDVSLDTNMNYSIAPYSSYSGMEKSLNDKTVFQKGIILTEDMAHTLNLNKKNLSKTTITLHVGVPISQKIDKNTFAVVEDPEHPGKMVERKISSRAISYKEITLRLPIRGIIKNTGSFQIRSTDAQFFLPCTDMESIYKKYNRNYMPNAYFAKIDDVAQLPNIKKSITKVSSTLIFSSLFDYYHVSHTMTKILHTLEIMTLIPLVLILFMVFYSLIYKLKERADIYDRIQAYGYSPKACDHFIVQFYLCRYCIFIVICCILFFVLSSFLHSQSLYFMKWTWSFVALSFLVLNILYIGADLYVSHKKR